MPLSKIFALVQKNVSAAVDIDRDHLDKQTPVLGRSASNVDFALRDSMTASLERKPLAPNN